jgi:uncharacterized surface anchored protein
MTFPGADGKLILIVDEVIIHEEDQFSVYKAIDNILKRLNNEMNDNNYEPLFICSCGEVGCNFSDFSFRVNNGDVNIEVWTDQKRSSDKTLKRKIQITIKKQEFFRVLCQLILNYLSYIWKEELTIKNINISDIEQRIIESNDESLNCINRHLPAFENIFKSLA